MSPDAECLRRPHGARTVFEAQFAVDCVTRAHRCVGDLLPGAVLDAELVGGGSERVAVLLAVALLQDGDLFRGHTRAGDSLGLVAQVDELSGDLLLRGAGCPHRGFGAVHVLQESVIAHPGPLGLAPTDWQSKVKKSIRRTAPSRPGCRHDCTHSIMCATSSGACSPPRQRVRESYPFTVVFRGNVIPLELELIPSLSARSVRHGARGSLVCGVGSAGAETSVPPWERIVVGASWSARRSIARAGLCRSRRPGSARAWRPPEERSLVGHPCADGWRPRSPPRTHRPAAGV